MGGGAAVCPSDRPVVGSMSDLPNQNPDRETKLPKPGDRDVSTSFPHRLGLGRLDRAARRRTVARLFRMGWRYADIARLLGVCTNTVSKDIRKLKDQYAGQAVQDIKVWLADALCTIDDVEAEAWEQWSESKGRRRTKRVRKVSSGGAVTMENTVEVLTPNDAYLRIVLDCVRRREDLLGLDKQTAQEIRTTLILQGGLSLSHYEQVSLNELEAIRDALIEQGGGGRDEQTAIDQPTDATGVQANEAQAPARGEVQPRISEPGSSAN